MRVLLDTNILISYLLHKDKNNIFKIIVESGIENKYSLLIPQDTLIELKDKLIHKKYLKKFITTNEVKEFINILESNSELVSQIKEEIPSIVRDKKDDYLIACAVVSEADYLVSGDKDLLILKKIGKLKIITPREFSEKLKK